MGKISSDYIKKATLLSRQGKKESEATTVVTHKIPITRERRRKMRRSSGPYTKFS